MTYSCYSTLRSCDIKTACCATQDSTKIRANLFALGDNSLDNIASFETKMPLGV